MRLIPALDLIDGRVVRLSQGDYAKQTTYTEDAIDQALAYEAAGAQWLHVVDLDSARSGGTANLGLIEKMCRALTIPVQCGGGVRTKEDIQKRLDLGIRRVVVGSVCIQTPELFIDWLGHFGPGALVAGLDVKAEQNEGAPKWIPQASGWTQASDQDLWSLLDQFMPAGLLHCLCTDIARDGMLQGSATELYQQLHQRYPDLAIQASGGIGQVADLERTQATGVAGCIVGRALLEGKVGLSDIGRFQPTPADAR